MGKHGTRFGRDPPMSKFCGGAMAYTDLLAENDGHSFLGGVGMSGDNDDSLAPDYSMDDLKSRGTNGDSADGNSTVDQSSILGAHSITIDEAENNTLEIGRVIKNSTPLFEAIRRDEWKQALTFLKSGNICSRMTMAENATSKTPRMVPPEEQVRTWISLYQPNGKLVWRRLAIHDAICRGAPFDLITTMIRFYPLSLQAQDSDGNLPLHLAMQYDCAHNVIELLIQEKPDAMEARNNKGLRPLECVQKNKKQGRESPMRGQVLQRYVTSAKNVVYQHVPKLKDELFEVNQSIEAAKSELRLAKVELGLIREQQRLSAEKKDQETSSIREEVTRLRKELESLRNEREQLSAERDLLTQKCKQQQQSTELQSESDDSQTSWIASEFSEMVSELEQTSRLMKRKPGSTDSPGPYRSPQFHENTLSTSRQSAPFADKASLHSWLNAPKKKQDNEIKECKTDTTELSYDMYSEILSMEYATQKSFSEKEKSDISTREKEDEERDEAGGDLLQENKITRNSDDLEQHQAILSDDSIEVEEEPHVRYDSTPHISYDGTEVEEVPQIVKKNGSLSSNEVPDNMSSSDELKHDQFAQESLDDEDGNLQVLEMPGDRERPLAESHVTGGEIDGDGVIYSHEESCNTEDEEGEDDVQSDTKNLREVLSEDTRGFEEALRGYRKYEKIVVSRVRPELPVDDISHEKEERTTKYCDEDSFEADLKGKGVHDRKKSAKSKLGRFLEGGNKGARTGRDTSKCDENESETTTKTTHVTHVQRSRDKFRYNARSMADDLTSNLEEDEEDAYSTKNGRHYSHSRRYSKSMADDLTAGFTDEEESVSKHSRRKSDKKSKKDKKQRSSSSRRNKLLAEGREDDNAGERDTRSEKRGLVTFAEEAEVIEESRDEFSPYFSEFDNEVDRKMTRISRRTSRLKSSSRHSRSSRHHHGSRSRSRSTSRSRSSRSRSRSSNASHSSRSISSRSSRSKDATRNIYVTGEDSVEILTPHPQMSFESNPSSASIKTEAYGQGFSADSYSISGFHSVG